MDLKALVGLPKKLVMAGEEANEEERMAERKIRPTTWDDYVPNGNEPEVMRRWLEGAKRHEEQPDHLLISGPPGTGKTVLSNLVAQDFNHHVKVYAGKGSSDIISELYTVQEHPGMAVFMDEIHAMDKIATESVQLAMEGNLYRRMKPWTLIGATTKPGRIEQPIRDRFGLIQEMSYYTEDKIALIATKSAAKLNMELQPLAAEEIGSRSRGVPRVANRLLRRVRDVYDSPTPRQVDEALVELGIDSWGLEKADRGLILLMATRFKGGPVGLKTLAGAFGTEPTTIVEVFEPYLIRKGLIDIVPRGRQLTPVGFKYAKEVLKRG